jgi:hypothetical protein
MGDNVSFNIAHVRELGITLSKCMAHAVNLTVMHGVSHLPVLDTLTTTAGSLNRAGGSGKRWAQLVALGLRPGEMMTLSTRFVSLVKNAKYRLGNFDLIREWTLALGEAGAAAAAGDDDDSDEDEIPDATEDAVATATSTKGKRIEAVVAAYTRPDAKVHLIACDQLFSRAITLIELCSANANGASAELIASLKAYGRHLATMATRPGAIVVRPSTFHCACFAF